MTMTGELLTDVALYSSRGFTIECNPHIRKGKTLTEALEEYQSAGLICPEQANEIFQGTWLVVLTCYVSDDRELVTVATSQKTAVSRMWDIMCGKPREIK